jgi:hypothetical protein
MEGHVDQIELAVPSAIARELVADGIGRQTLHDRDADWIAVATLAVDAISTLAVLTVNRAELLSTVRRVAACAKKEATGGPRIEVHISVEGVSRIVSEKNDEAGVRRLEVRVLAMLEDRESGDEPRDV